MRNRIFIALLVAAGCQPPTSSNPLSLENDYRVAPQAPVGERNLGITYGDGPNKSHLIFLNFEGGSIVPAPDGFTDNSAVNQSWMAKSTRTMPAFDATPYTGQYTRDTAIAAITNQYKAYYAAYNVSISTTRPASGRYTMVMIGGSPSDLQGGSNNTSEAGVSPLDCGNMEESNIAFNFAATLAPNQTGFGIPDAIKQIAADAAHESGHSFGLEHVNDVTDVMNPVLEPTITGFHGLNTLSDGSSSCGSGTKQDTNGLLITNLGAATSQPVTTPPTVSFSSPADGADVSLSFTVQIAAAATTGATISKVDLSEGSKLLATLTSAPYTHTLTVTAGAHDYTAVATDSNGQTASAMLSVTAEAGNTNPMPTPSPTNQPSPSPTTPPSSLSGGSFGDSCTTAGECASALCVGGVCSEHCGATQACPASYACNANGLCQPPAHAGSASSGCSVAGTRDTSAPLWLLALFALAVFRRSRLARWS